MADYSPQVSQLLTYEEPRGTDYRLESWPDYVQEFGLTPDHAPDLIRLMTAKIYWEEEDSDEDGVWAPCHAWRALAQLKATEAVVPLLDLFEEYDDDDYLNEETPEVLGAIGAEVLPIIEPYLQREDYSMWGKNAIVLGVLKLAETYPEDQLTCIDIMLRQLEGFQNNDSGVNGWIVDGLVKFKVMDAVPLIERVYKEGDIDEMCAGTWPKVQVRLGLKRESDFTEDEMIPEMMRNIRAMMPDMATLERALGQRKPSAFEMGLPLNREAMTPEAPPKFGEGFLKAPKSAAPKPSQGFGKNTGAQSSSKKKKKKKK